MKSKPFLLIFLFSFSQIFSHEMSKFTGIVDKIEGITIFMFSKPDEKYHEVGKAASTGYIIKMGVNETKSVDEKAHEMVKSALKKKENGKVGEFDAIIFNPKDLTSKAIKFKD